MDSEWYDCVSSGVVAIIANKCEDLLRDLIHTFYLANPAYLDSIIARRQGGQTKQNRYRALLNLCGVITFQDQQQGLRQLAVNDIRTLLTCLKDCAFTLASRMRTRGLEETQIVNLLNHFNNLDISALDHNNCSNLYRVVREQFLVGMNQHTIRTLSVMMARELISGEYILKDELTLKRAAGLIFRRQEGVTTNKQVMQSNDCNPEADIVKWLRNSFHLGEHNMRLANTFLSRINDTRVGVLHPSQHGMQNHMLADPGSDSNELSRSFQWIARESGLFEATYMFISDDLEVGLAHILLV